MAEFVYKATKTSGEIVEGSMEGHDESAVVHSLHELGYIPVRVIPAGEPGAGARFSFLPQRVGLKHLLALSQELSTLVTAGLPIDRSLQILGSLAKNPKLKGVVQDILNRVREGSSLADALGNHPRIFSKLYVNMVKAGESGGFLEVILSRLVKYLQSAKELRDFLVSVMIYPLILTAVSGASIIILVTFVIPRFAKIFSDMGQAIPLPTQVLLTLSQVVRDYWWLGVGVLALIYFSLRTYNQKEERRFRWDRSKLRWPAVGNIIKKIEVARFSRTLATLLQSGVPILSALNLVKEISQNLAVSRAIGNIHDRLREGKAVARTLEETGVFPPLAVHMISVGEETGRMEEMLSKVAETYEADVQTTVKRFVSLLEPLIILFMGAVVGFIVISMLLAIFSINEIPF
jgi:general secretion pathway protein F